MESASNSKGSSGRPRRYTATEWCRRYLSLSAVAVTGALVYVLFFNDHSILNHYEYERQIESLKVQIKENTDTLDYYRRLNSNLETDRTTMERIVREQYHMQRPSEDVFLTD